MQIKTIMRYHCIPSMVGIIKKRKENMLWWQGCGEVRTLVHRCGKCKMRQLLWKSALHLLRRLNIS